VEQYWDYLSPELYANHHPNGSDNSQQEKGPSIKEEGSKRFSK
jgi:hypothetical protein